MLRYYADKWHRGRALLIGYSQGADVLSFGLNQLPPTSRALVARTVLMALGETASFEFHLDNWMGGDRGAIGLPYALRRNARGRIQAQAHRTAGEHAQAHELLSA